MQRERSIPAGSFPLRWSGRTGFERLAAIAGMAAVAVLAADWSREEQVLAALPADTVERTARGAPETTRGPHAAAGREILAGGYLGITHTHPSTVTIRNPGRTDMTLGPVAWQGMPFKSPIYYGVRASNWPASARFGSMLDFTHAKAISRFADEAGFTGTLEGKALPPRARIGDVFKHLEFSHGHNMLTVNGLMRLGSFRVQPYVGAGAGISLPHTEIGFRSESGRTYEYQYAGLAGQVLAGLEVRVGGASIFLEYKLSYAPYDVPLSGVVNGWLLFTDLWRQFRAWTAGEAPPGGRLTTPLLTHHVIGGAMVRVMGAKAAAAP